jgi:hypothetical protein
MTAARCTPHAGTGDKSRRRHLDGATPREHDALGGGEEVAGRGAVEWGPGELAVHELRLAFERGPDHAIEPRIR